MSADPSTLKLDIIQSPTVRARHWQAERWSWTKLVKRLTRGPVADHKDCGLWAAVAVNGGRRRSEDLLHRGAIVLDIDRATAATLLDLQMALADWEYVITTTYSATPELPRYRLVVPTDAPVTAAGARLLTAYVARVMCGLGDELDATSLDPVHAMYWPAEKPGSGTYRAWHHRGRLLPAAALLADAALWAADEPDAVLAGGGTVYGYDGPAYQELPPVRQELARLRTQQVVDESAVYLHGLLKLDEGAVDDRGHGWDSGSLVVAARLMRLAGSAWAPLDLEGARQAYYRALPDEMRNTEPTCDKWRPNDYERVLTKYGALPPPWEDVPFTPLGEDPEDDGGGDEGGSGDGSTGGGSSAAGSSGTGGGKGGKGGTAGKVARGVRPGAPADTVPIALAWLKDEAGQRGLVDLFLHNGEVVRAPRQVTSRTPAGELTVDRATVDLLMALIHTNYRPVTTGRNGAPKDADSFRRQAVMEWLADPRDSAHLPVIHRVVRHPVFRADGTWLHQPGYDAASGILYLPNGLVLPPVPVRPAEADLGAARRYLDAVLGDFPWDKPHDRANYLAGLLTPLLMEMFPPPYMFMLLTAPQAGSGKSLLADILRAVYGGAFRADLFKGGEDEVRKYITSVLQVYDGPIVQIDNMSGTLASPMFDALTTTPTWSDRRLGTNQQVTVRNDRLWVGTGNNVRVAGDTRRRTLSIRIDPGLERPQERTAFFVEGMREWINMPRTRSRIIHALAVLVAHWVAEGMPAPAVTTSDGYEGWIAGMRGVLACAAMGEDYGVVGTVDWEADLVLADDQETQERYDFYSALYRIFGEEQWRARQVVDNIGGRLPVDALPDHVRRVFMRGDASMGRVVGNWLSAHGDTWAEGLGLKRLPLRANNATWWAVQATDDARRRIRQEVESAESDGNVLPFHREDGDPGVYESAESGETGD